MHMASYMAYTSVSPNVARKLKKKLWYFNPYTVRNLAMGLTIRNWVNLYLMGEVLPRNYDHL